MIHKIYTVYDHKAECYMKPFYMRSRGEALRSFADTVNTPDHPFNKYPEDFTLFECGEWDDEICKFELMITHTPCGKAIEYLRTYDGEISNGPISNETPIQPGTSG